MEPINAAKLAAQHYKRRELILFALRDKPG
jgi:hypothetical protein